MITWCVLTNATAISSTKECLNYIYLSYVHPKYKCEQRCASRYVNYQATNWVITHIIAYHSHELEIQFAMLEIKFKLENYVNSLNFKNTTVSQRVLGEIILHLYV